MIEGKLSSLPLRHPLSLKFGEESLSSLLGMSVLSLSFSLEESLRGIASLSLKVSGPTMHESYDCHNK